MFSSLAIVLLLAAASSAALVPRIYGGNSVLVETFPYQVSLEWSNRHDCGGSIISPYWILTAAHCVVDSEIDSYRVRAGTSFVEASGTLHGVEKIVKHRGFGINSMGSGLNDVALVKLTDPIVFDDTHQPIEMFEYNEEVQPDSMAVVSGWGQTPTTWKPKQLQAVAVPMISKQFCSELYGKRFGPLPAGEICALAYGEGGKDACTGDSGGPLVIEGRLAGIVSWGDGCGGPYQPGVYTEVAYFRKWIDQAMNDSTIYE